MMWPKIGAHMSIAGGHERAIHALKAVGGEALQLFTKGNNQWKAKPLEEAQVALFRQALTEAGLSNPIAHNSYLINLASPDDKLWNQSIDAMVVELERAEALGIPDLVAHPGAHVGSGEAAGLERIALALDEIHRRTRGFRARIDLETTAGQGTCLGHRFEQLGRIFELVSEPERLGVCVDTCHIFAAGYPLGTPEQYNELIDALDRAVGIARVRVWHLNDSVRELGSRVDRHAGIGLGKLGLEPFRFILNDKRFAHLPMVMETPKGVEAGEEWDVINLRVLRGLLAVEPAIITPAAPRRSGSRR